MKKIVLIGIGQYLRGDDSAGLEEVNTWMELHWRQAMSYEVQVELAESPGLNLLSLMKGAQAAILVDAVQSGARPGTIHLLRDDELVAFLPGAGSAHGWGVIETLRLGKLISPEDLPASIFLIGIEGAQFEPGREISPEIRSALSEAAAQINQYILQSAKT